MAFTSIGYDGSVNEKQWAELVPSVGSATYGVKGADDLQVSAVAGQPLTVSVASGSGWGHGVLDTETANTTIACDTISSGTRWDLIALRRNWQPLAGGPSSVVKVTGTATKELPGGRKAEPGVEDDQPLALVQWTAGQTQPTQIVDMRCWAGNGGLVARDDLVRTYLNTPGTQIHINGVDWTRVVGDNNIESWVSRYTGPYRQWFAVTTKTLTGTGGWWNVPLPSGLFTVPPLVFLTKQSAVGAGHVPYHLFDEATTSNIRVGAFWGGNANTFDVTLGIHAVQANPTTAGGLLLP